MVRAIQIGVGNWGLSWSRDVIPHVPSVTPVAYVDANPEALERLRATVPVEAGLCFSSLAEAAEAVEAELVIATLRTEAHYLVVREALERGFHVLVEKPFASTLREARGLVAAAERAGRFLMVSQNYRFHPAPMRVAEMVAGDALGPVGMVSVDFRKHAPSIGYLYWEMPDPLFADMAIHHFDLLRMVLSDEPKRVSCRSWNTPGSRFVHHPVGVATIEFERGTVASYRGSWMSGAPDTPWAGDWSLDCAQGEIRWSSRDRRPDAVRPDRLAIRRPDGAEETPVLPPLIRTDREGALDAMATTIAAGSAPAFFSSGADNLMSLALVRASLRSAAREGAWVEIAELIEDDDA